MGAATKKTSACLLFATDFEQPARRAFKYGLKFARLLGLRMEILHVIRAPSDRSGTPTGSHYLRSVKTSAWLNLGRLARVAKDAGVQVESCMQFSYADACIV